jgi:hypothetical protein
VYNVEGGWNIPANLSADEILPYHTTKPNGANVLVPGFFAGMYSTNGIRFNLNNFPFESDYIQVFVGDLQQISKTQTH